MLKDLNLRISYSSGNVNIVKAFYVPCMMHSRLYRRAVGYFTSQGLSIAARGVAHLLDNGGKIQLIASPCLSDQDIEAIERGCKSREEVLAEVAAKTFQEIENVLIRERLNALSWLVATGSLDVRLALPVDRNGRLKKGIYHEKMGIFNDAFDNSVAFSGSPNETAGGLIENYEAIDVFWSWNDPQGRVGDKISRFDNLWNNKSLGLQVIEFTQATKDLLAMFKMEKKNTKDPEELEVRVDPFEGRKIPMIPPEVQLRDYQQEAVTNWIKNNGRGMFKMATGTGKTIIGLAVAVTLYGRFNLKAMVVVCPYRHLVTQWSRECEKFGFEPICAFESRGQWEGLLTTSLFNVTHGNTDFVCVVTTNTTFGSDLFQNRLRFFPEKTLIIADEVHNLGAPHLQKCLPENIKLRLALSATPERWFDELGTEQLINYFGQILNPQLTIKDAIARKALVPYRYYPILIELSDDEREEYLLLSEKIAKVSQRCDANEEDNPILLSLLIRRARLVANARNKQDVLRELMEGKKQQTHMLFYCGDGTVGDPVNEEETRQVENVTRLLGHDLGIRVAPYTAETVLGERESLRQRLDTGELQGLVAIRCLDEGVDIPSIRTAIILASSRNPRQFIQRRGRILRPAPGKSSAEIYDMIVVPPKELEVYESERTLLRSELRRFAEFADLAMNSGEARLKIFDLQKRYDLMDI